MQRFTISLDEALAGQFDDWIARKGYSNRSEAVRDLLRAQLQQADLQRDDAQPLGQDPAHTASRCVASLSYVYNCREMVLVERLARLQHDHHQLVQATMQLQLDHEHRLENVALRGGTQQVVAFADAVCAQRGVHHGRLNLVSVEEHLAHRHGSGDEHPPHVHLRPAH